MTTLACRARQASAANASSSSIMGVQTIGCRINAVPPLFLADVGLYPFSEAWRSSSRFRRIVGGNVGTRKSKVFVRASAGPPSDAFGAPAVAVYGSRARHSENSSSGQQWGAEGGDSGSSAEITAALSQGRSLDAAKCAARLLRAGGCLEDNTARRILQSLASERNYQAAARFFEMYSAAAPSFGYSVGHFAVVAYANLGRVSGLRAALRDMRALGYEANRSTLTGAIGGLCRQHKSRRGLGKAAQAAYELWGELQGAREGLDAGALRAGLSACVAYGRVDEAVGLVEAAAAEHPDWLDAGMWNRLVPGLVAEGRVADLEGLVGWMRRCGVEPSEVTWNALVNAGVELGGAEGGERHLRAAGDAGGRVGVWGWCAVLKGYVAEGRVEEAWGLVERMRRAGTEPNHACYGALMNAHARRGEAGECREVAEEALAAGVQLRAVEWNTLVRVQAAGGGPGIDEAFGTLGRMVRGGTSPDAVTYNTLMSACAADGDYTSVAKLFEALREAGLQPDAASYTAVLQAHVGTDNMQAAEDVLSEMVSCEGAAVDAVPFCVLVDGYASRQGRMEHAEGAVRRLLALHRSGSLAEGRGGGKGVWGVKVFGALMKGYRRARDVEGGLRAMAWMVEEGIEPDIALLDGLAELCILTGEWKKATGIVQAMAARGHLTGGQQKRCVELLRKLAAGEVAVKDQLYGLGGAGAGETGGAAELDGGTELERVKFWLGLPNRYYGDPNWP